MVAYYCWILLSLHSFALNGVTDGCLGLQNTPWMGMCKEECFYGLVVFSECRNTTLPSGSYSGVSDNLTISFEDSCVTDVSRRAFSGITALNINLRNSFVKFEPEAFAGLTVYELYIWNNPNLTSLPSGVFRGVIGIERLDMRRNNLQSLTSGIFIGLEGLKQLIVMETPISCLAYDTFYPLRSLNKLYLPYGESVDIDGFCSQTFRGIRPEVHYGNPLDWCVKECGGATGYMNTRGTYRLCDCYSNEGCITCEGNITTDNTLTVDPLPTAGGVSTIETFPTLINTFLVLQATIMIRSFSN